jgi:hypothetical protein
MKRLIAVLAVSMAMAFGLAACEPDDGTGGSPGVDAPGLESPAMESPMESLAPIGS